MRGMLYRAFEKLNELAWFFIEKLDCIVSCFDIGNQTSLFGYQIRAALVIDYLTIKIYLFSAKTPENFISL